MRSRIQSNEGAASDALVFKPLYCIRNYQYQEFGRALVATITPSL